MAEIVFLTGTIGSIVHEVACDEVVMSGSVPVAGWIDSVLGATPYDLDAVRQVVVPQLPALFDPRYDVLDYADLAVAPVPQISHIVPESLEAGGADVELHVHGSHFTPRSVIVFNDGEETTTFVSTMELVTMIVGAIATTPGVFPVEVTTPGPGGGMSVGRSFHVLDPAAVTVRRTDGVLTWEVPAS